MGPLSYPGVWFPWSLAATLYGGRVLGDGAAATPGGGEPEAGIGWG